MKVCINGYYGFHNVGDELILHHVCQVLIGIRSDLQISVVSDDPAYTERLHHIRGVDRNDYAAITQEVQDADLVVVGGGGLFQDHHRIDVSQMFTDPQLGVTSYANVPHLAKIFHIPVAYLFQGVGPLFSDEAMRFSQWAFSLADCIIVRDEASVALLERLGIQNVVLGLDPVLLGPKVDSTPRPTSCLRIGISLRQWIHQETEDRVVHAVAEFIHQLQSSSGNFEILLLSFQECDAGNRDSLVLENVLKAVKDGSRIDLVNLSERGLADAEQVFADLDYVIGMRFHALLLALKYKKPFLALGYDQKVHSLMQELRLKEFLLDLTQVTPEIILEKFLCLRDQFPIGVTPFEAIEQSYAVRAESSLQALRQFLEPLVAASSVPAILQWAPTTSAGEVSAIEYEYVRAHLNEIRQELWGAQRQQSLLHKTIVEQTTTIGQLESTIHSQQAGLAEREQRIEQLEVAIRSQQTEISQRDEMVRQFETTIQGQHDVLNAISHSAGWKLLVAFGAAKDKAFPDGSRRRRLYDTLFRWMKACLGAIRRREGVRQVVLLGKSLSLTIFAFLYRVLKRAIPQRLRQPLKNLLKRIGVDVSFVKGNVRGKLGVAPQVFKERSWGSGANANLEKAWPSHAPIVQAHLYDLVCFPIIDWDFRFQRPQQLMSCFGEAGHRVFFLSQRFHSSSEPYVIRRIQKNIYEVSLHGPAMNVYARALDKAGLDDLFTSLNALRRDLALAATVSMVQLPFWAPLARKAQAEFGWPIVYDCMDDHSGFSTNNPQMIMEEQSLFEAADLVLASSSLLEKKARSHHAHVLLLRNACEYEHFANVGIKTRSKRPVIGYYGAIADWFDSDLVADLAAQRRDWDFVLVGSTYTADLSRLEALPNVRLTGECPYQELPQWLDSFDVVLIPFKRLPLTEATNPVKAYEILAAGKPLISVPLPEMVSLGPLVRLASTSHEFESEIVAALDENDPTLREQRQTFARDNTWQDRFRMLAASVPAVFPKASIIVVTFNNLDLNRLCLESIFAKTEWPNVEVIVVDNGSTDGTPDYLQEQAKIYPTLSVIANSENLGFAAANNLALQQATGKYLVLLNNDTVVTRGWLSMLLRHLHTNAKLGLVGPVTNAISNQAKISVGYSDLSDLPYWAAEFTREHDGLSYPIPMLALFCTAMPRSVFEEVGLLDERFAVGMFEDDDYCRRVRDKGFDLRYAADAFVHHWQGASFRLFDEQEYLRIFDRNKQAYEAKWGETWKSAGVRLAQDATATRNGENCERVYEYIRNSQGAVIFLPSVGWDIPLFQRPHHLARMFAHHGYISIFDCSNANDDVEGFQEIEPNLFLFRGREELLHAIPNPILWAFTYNYDMTDAFPKPARILYDWIDALEVFPYDQQILRRTHERALREATLVMSVSKILYDKAQVVRSDAVYLPNAVDYWPFAYPPITGTEHSEILAIRREGKPIAGYYGALARWFDYDLLEAVATLRPDWIFLLIGPDHDGSLQRSSLLSCSNIRWVGSLDYHILPGCLSMFDVAMIPFLLNNLTRAVSPLKLFEYLAGGKPVISTPLPECALFPEVSIVRDASAFASALDVAKREGEDSLLREGLRRRARENTWCARVKTVTDILETQGKSGEEFNDQESSHVPVLTGTAESQAFEQQQLDQGALEIATQFQEWRTSNNTRFFDALAGYFSDRLGDPCLPMYFEFAITCNDRGRMVANILKKYVSISGKRLLDVGCAFAGFPVAFAEQGAVVTGMDIQECLLALGQCNLLDNGLGVPLLKKDATDPEEVAEFFNAFHIITCNDVIEHVSDPFALLGNINSMLCANGVAYFEIPNRFLPNFVLKDGHYQFFGITLLDYPEAKEYFGSLHPNQPYNMGHYLTSEEYSDVFRQAGLSFTLLEENFDNLEIQAILSTVEELREGTEKGLATVPEPLRDQVAKRLVLYLDDVDSFPRATPSEQRRFLIRFGMSFWRILARKNKAI